MTYLCSTCANWIGEGCKYKTVHSPVDPKIKCNLYFKYMKPLNSN